MGGKALDLMKSYLSNRKFKLVTNGLISMSDTNCGHCDTAINSLQLSQMYTNKVSEDLDNNNNWDERVIIFGNFGNGSFKRKSEMPKTQQP